MALLQPTTKRVAISKANAQTVIIASIAAFISIFCLVSSSAIFTQVRYQAKLIAAKEDTRDQLDENLDAFEDLQKSYKTFDNAPLNVIGGLSSGTGDQDGRNSKIILDALPSSYDFPALTSSIEKITRSQSTSLSKIEGIDDQAAQEAAKKSPEPKAVEMPFSFTVEKTDSEKAAKLIDILQRSIRPIQVDELKLTQTEDGLEASFKARTFYQPGTAVNVTKKVVK
jgi:hypothetical protein